MLRDRNLAAHPGWVKDNSKKRAFFPFDPLWETETAGEAGGSAEAFEEILPTHSGKRSPSSTAEGSKAEQKTKMKQVEDEISRLGEGHCWH
ncbi:hypothetical protein C4D60_Mb05t28310 [Musa balbisiana]|uniref:Uncharacterized protein n=1 Tax=Musa balbisiana TaxID=52838 RepID=A0A4S8JZF4_MUSBA|nr:hypothetical protein C4D60_Mb05t28310 [Musa balbisiana]